MYEIRKNEIGYFFAQMFGDEIYPIVFFLFSMCRMPINVENKNKICVHLDCKLRRMEFRKRQKCTYTNSLLFYLVTSK